MTARFSRTELSTALGLIDKTASQPGSISTDTRTLESGQWYLALKGEQFDGHKFVQQALQKGAAGAIVERSYRLPDHINAGQIIAVDDTLTAYHDLATYWRKQVNPLVVAITGSSGKTTTKEITAAIFEAARKTHKSNLNENNEIGLPKTILSMPADTQVLILEMGMRGLRQIDLLAQTAKPDIGMITNAGTAHIELLGSKENIARAKSELFAHLDRSNGLGIIGMPTDYLLAEARRVFNGDLKIFQSNSLKEKSVTIDQTDFVVEGVNQSFTIKAHGSYILQDAWCAIVAALRAGLSAEEIARGLSNYRPVEGRGLRLTTLSGATIVDESYNANPDSVRCAVQAIVDGRAFPQLRKLVVLGEMAELGESALDLHVKLGQWLKDQPLSLLVTVGEQAENIARGAKGAKYAIETCATNDEAAQLLSNKISNDCCVMVKGSHRARLDLLVAQLKGL